MVKNFHNQEIVEIKTNIQKSVKRGLFFCGNCMDHYKNKKKKKILMLNECFRSDFELNIELNGFKSYSMLKPVTPSNQDPLPWDDQ